MATDNDYTTNLRFERGYLNSLYKRLNRPDYIHPDPLEFLSRYDAPQDIEVVGLVASSLAYGRVAQILKSVQAVLDIMGPSPADFATSEKPAALIKKFAGFKHRFTTGEDLASMISGAGKAIREHGSLEACFKSYLSPDDTNILNAMSGFVCELKGGGEECCYLTPAPEKGSACKRMNLYLRWMIRKDAVDPGPWESISPSLLVIPLDTHMHRIGRALGLTSRKQGDMKTALEITSGFAGICPDDPVKYDFALTRLGIRGEKA